MPIAQHEEVLLGHGSGGTLTAELLERVFLPRLANPVLDRMDDQARLEVDGARLAFTTDAFVVSPIFFPGGDIGSLSVHGTVNDLAVGGAEPLYIAAAFVLEEGLPLRDLERVVASMADAAAAAGVQVVAGDTKVVGRGACDGLYVVTTGIGRVPRGVCVAADGARPGDAVLVSGTVGDHGMAIVSLREGLGLEGTIESDSAALNGLVAEMLVACPDVHAMRDATRGGLAAVVNEIAAQSGVGVELDERSIPVREQVRGACELLGFDPLVVANEGKLVAFVPEAAAGATLAAMRAHPLGRDAACIGRVTGANPGQVALRTGIGGSRVLVAPHGELLPRIC
ncbi:MAG: hydrogenase expression/formation protein HypE [Myxococcales bacterium]|nr:hydrogenase expression/formation protein HypE [Myxococcales bacterium]